MVVNDGGVVGDIDRVFARQKKRERERRRVAVGQEEAVARKNVPSSQACGLIGLPCGAARLDFRTTTCLAHTGDSWTCLVVIEKRNEGQQVRY